MTRQEAIEILEKLAYPTERIGEALDMAIKALQGDMYCPSCGVRLVSENEYAEPSNAQNTLQHVGNVGDVISRADVIATVTKWASGEGGDIIELLESLPLAEPSWIPCSERLPSEGYTPVLISGYIEEVNYNSVQIARYRNGTWWYCDGSQEPVISKVTAWMPLPQPYSIESDGIERGESE